MNWGTRAQFYKEFLNTFRKGHWGQKGKVTYKTLPQNAKTEVKDIIRAMNEDKVAELTKNPLLTQSSSGGRTLGEWDAMYTIDSDKVSLPLSVLRQPATIPHEARHAQQFRRLDKLGSTGIPVWKDYDTGSDMFMFHTEEGVNIPLGKKDFWDYMYGGNSNSAEVDALLSEYATVSKARRISDSRKIKKTGSAATPEVFNRRRPGQPPQMDIWEGLPDVVKKHYLETAGIAGLGFMSAPKLQGEEEEV
jgi:hypothetical protein